MCIFKNLYKDEMSIPFLNLKFSIEKKEKDPPYQISTREQPYVHVFVCRRNNQHSLFTHIILRTYINFLRSDTCISNLSVLLRREEKVSF